MNWTIKCPVCHREFDSMVSYADTKIMLRAHIDREHPSEKVED